MTDDDETSSSDEDNSNFEIKNDVQKAIVDAFMLFTENGKKYISIADIGKILRHLGCVPSEEELNEFASHVVNKKKPKTIKLEVFVSHAEKEIGSLKYKPATANELLQAFQTLDTENKGFFSLDFMQQILREGESFSDDEITEALKIAFDPDSECIYYDLWIHKLMGKTKMDVYALIPDDDKLAKQAAAEAEDKLNRLLMNDQQ